MKKQKSKGKGQNKGGYKRYDKGGKAKQAKQNQPHKQEFDTKKKQSSPVKEEVSNMRVYKGTCLIKDQPRTFTVVGTSRNDAWQRACKDTRRQKIRILPYIMVLDKGLNTMRSMNRKVLNMRSTMLLVSKDGINFNVGDSEHIVVSPYGLDGILGVALTEDKIVIQLLNKKKKTTIVALPITEAIKKLTYVENW